MSPTLRRRLPRLLIVPVLAASFVVATAPTASAAQTIGFPVFGGPAIPQPTTAYNNGNMLRAIYDAEAAGTDFYIDRLLGRSGTDPADADGGVLMTRGRALYMRVHNPNVLGFGGTTAYIDNVGNQNAIAVTASTGTFVEQPAQRFQAPSHFRSVHTSGAVRITQTKFITQNNVAVANLAVTNTGSSSTTVQLRATSPFAATVSGAELTGQSSSFNGLTTLYPRLSGDGFAAANGALTQSVTVAAGATVTTKVQIGFVTNEIPESRAEYDAYRGYSPAAAFATHVRAYNLWWADNIPYFDAPEPAIEKNYYYRWWLMRFNHLDANIPGQTYQFPTSIEGVLGYNNAIVLTTPMHMDDLKYLRNPLFSYSNWLSAGQVSKNGRFLDNPGDPANWSNSYTQYIGEAAWRAYQIHGGQPALLNSLAHYAERDAKDQLAFYDRDGDKVIEYDWGALTGNDADAVSFDYRQGQRLDRAEGAYQYSGARAAASAYRALGNTAKANELDALAGQIQNGLVNQLWNPSRQLFEHRVSSTNEFVPWKEINNYYPFAVGAVPNTDTYKAALRLFDDPAQYPIFPFYTANQVDKANAAAAGHPGSNNFSTINSTVQLRLYSSVLRNYPNQWMTAEHYKKLLYWNAWAQYVGGDTRWPDANEFWANWNGSAITYRSWIHHNILGSSNWTLIEDVAGLRPRDDGQIQLSPINIGWSHFAVNNLRYRNVDISVVWDDPADGVTRYPGVPQGYSVFVNGGLAVTVDRLVPFTYNPATGAVQTSGAVTYSRAVPGVQAPTQVVQNNSRVVDVAAKAGIDLAGSVPNLAAGAGVGASYTASGTSTASAVDGFPTNEPFWGTAGSPNGQDWLELNLGSARPVNEVRLHFKDSRPASGSYRAPASYTVQYLDGSTWRDVASQAKSPANPVANYNQVTFTTVSAQRLRVLVSHVSGAKTGLTEVKVYNRGGGGSGNLATAATPSASYTSPWESVAAINDGIDPPSSNDTVNRRWGTWPETGTQWAELTWPSATSVSRAEVYFFDDEGGIDMPSSWKFQYWNGTAFVDIPGTYSRTPNAFNSVTFGAVSTTRLRAVLTSTGTASLGLLEVRAYR